MTIIVVDNNTKTILRYGMGVKNDGATSAYEIPDIALDTLSQPGVKTYDPASRTITVVPPAQPPPPTDYTALRGRVITIAQSTVGVTVDQLSMTQRLALVACLLYSAGALDPQSLAVRPLAQWVHDP